MSADHDHDHGHAHARAHAPAQFDRAFAIGIGLNTAFVAIEAFYGWRIDSLALLADAGHNLSDVAGLLLAWGGALAGRLRPDMRHTYGWKRASILAAFINAVLLLVAMGSLAWGAVHRLQSPQPIDGREFNIFSNTLPVLFENRDKITSKVERTEKGAVVTQTSTDAKVVAALQGHADEVTELARDGMLAMRRGMMARMAMGPGGPMRGMGRGFNQGMQPPMSPDSRH